MRLSFKDLKLAVSLLFKLKIGFVFVGLLFLLFFPVLKAASRSSSAKNLQNSSPPQPRKAVSRTDVKKGQSLLQPTKAAGQGSETRSKKPEEEEEESPSPRAKPPRPSIGLFQKDREYYTQPVFKNLNLIYSEGLKPYLKEFQQNIKRIDRELAKDHPIQPYFKPNYIVFFSSLKQKSNAYAGVYPFSFIGIHPSGSIYFIDRWAMLNWSHDALIHEMSHIYQLSHSSTLDRLLNLWIGFFSYRNNLLSTFAIEGHAVLSESMYGSGGRLFSGWVRAFVFSQLKQGDFKMSYLFKQRYPPFSGIDKYLHGGYFFAYLHHQYGVEKIHHLFAESRKYIPFGFYGLNSSMKRTFGKDFKSLFEEYRAYYAPLAEKQKSSKQRPVAFSHVFLPMNSNEQEIYFLTTTLKSPPELIRYIKKTGKVIRKRVQMPLGKLFYRKGEYYSSSIGRTSTVSTEFSLFKEGHWPIKKYNSRQVMDFHGTQDISIDTRGSYLQNSLLLNGEFYDSTHSSAVSDPEGHIYYFKQEGDRRVLYKNKQALVSYQSYYGYPVEADSSGVYFIGATLYGSSLFVYKKGKGVFRVLESDTVSYGRKIDSEHFLVSEIGPDRHEYKVEPIKEIRESPKLYSYSFKKKSIFEIPLKTSFLKGSDKEEDRLEELAQPSFNEDEWEEIEEVSKKALEKTNRKIAKEGTVEKRTRDQTRKKTGDQTGNQIGDQTGNQIGDQTGNQTGNQTGERTTEKTAETSDRKTVKEESSERQRQRQRQGKRQGKRQRPLNPSSKTFESAGEDIKKPDLATQSALYGGSKSPFLLNHLHSSYSPLAHLRLYQINIFLPIFSFPYIDKVHLKFNFTDPLQFNRLSFKTILGLEQRQFHLSYTYKKYRPSFSISFLYNEGRLRDEMDQIKTLSDISLLKIPLQCRKWLKDVKREKNPCDIPHRERYVSFLLKYPLYRRDFLLVSISQSLKWGEMQFFNRELLFKQFPYLFYKDKAWRPYVRFEGSLSTSYWRKYSQAYSFHKKREIEFLYDAFIVPKTHLEWGRRPLSYIATEINGQWVEELGREVFFSLNMSTRWNVWDSYPRYAPLAEEDQWCCNPSFSYRGQDLYHLDLKILKVLNHSWYPLKTPIALRRYAPLMGVASLLAKEQKGFNLFVIPFAGLEGEFVLEDKMIMKTGLGFGYVLSQKLHLLRESTLYPRRPFFHFWMKVNM